MKEPLPKSEFEPLNQRVKQGFDGRTTVKYGMSAAPGVIRLQVKLPPGHHAELVRQAALHHMTQTVFIQYILEAFSEDRIIMLPRGGILEAIPAAIKETTRKYVEEQVEQQVVKILSDYGFIPTPYIK